MRNLSNKYGKQLLDIAVKTELDALNNASKKVVQKAAETTGHFIGNKIAEKTVKQKPIPDENLTDVDKIIIAPQQREEMLNELRQVI